MRNKIDGIRVLGIINSWGISITDTRKIEWWHWANPVGVAVKVGPYVIRINRPTPYPEYWCRFYSWVNTWNGLVSQHYEAEARGGFYIAKPRPEWQ